jgi:drug/metabolite transporter (DMT)-like permease
MTGGFLFLTFVYWISGENPFLQPLPSLLDFTWLLILGLVCTAYAFVVSVDIMKVVSPYTVAISVNLEPVYSIIMALLIFGSEEYMSSGFYFGTIIILATIFGNAYLKSKKTVNPA